MCCLSRAVYSFPKPITRFTCKSKILIISQAPGTRAHNSGIPWNDASGKRLREWLDLSMDKFYDDSKIAIMPMGLCYPGADKYGGDMPPVKRCAPLWHDRIKLFLPNIMQVTTPTFDWLF
ncbi:MAG: hypothetical protein EOP34_11165 [Rickettsiales bacterium]|nr:MAG: hypothetical protein EOP34_11165 [Rickettsiales bacterium]